MRKFQITVNGQAYIVDVEEISGAAPQVTYVAPAPVAAPAPAPAPAAAPAPAPQKAAPVATAAPAGAETIKSPMPGTILKVLASQGAKVKKGDNLCILEAMKMENEIKSPRDGVVATIMVQKGATVNSGDALVALQ